MSYSDEDFKAFAEALLERERRMNYCADCTKSYTCVGFEWCKKENRRIRPHPDHGIRG